jgi:hypothetical protein
MPAAALAGAIALIPGGGAAAGAGMKALGYLLRCTTCLKVLGVAALIGWTALHVHHADAVRCTARIEDDHRKAEAAAADRDAGVARDLHEFFGPKLSQLQAENQTLQRKVSDYAKKNAAARPAKAAGGCKLGDAANLLRPGKPAP